MTIPVPLLAVLIAVVVLNSVALLALAADMGRLRLRLDPSSSDLAVVPDEGLAIGSPVPLREVTAMPGDVPISLHTGTRVVAFLSASCAPCRALWPELRRYAKEDNHPVTVVIGDDPADFLSDGRVTVVFDRDGGITSRWRVRRTPFVYFIAGGLVRAKGVVNRYEQIVTLIDGRGLPGPGEWADVPTPFAGASGDPS